MGELLKLTFKNIWRADFAAAIFIFLSFLFLRRVFTRYIFQVLRRLAKKTSTDFDDTLLAAFEGPLRVLFIILGFYFASLILALTPDQEFLILRFIRTALIFLITWGLYNLSGTILYENTAKKFGFQVDRILVPFMNKVLKFIVIALALSVIAQEWGYEISGLIAGLGLGGLAVALAAQDALSNILGGIVVITDKPLPSAIGLLRQAWRNGRGYYLPSTKIRAFTHADFRAQCQTG